MRRLACLVGDRWGGGVNPCESPGWRRISPARASELGLRRNSSEPHGRSARERQRAEAKNGRARSAAWVDPDGPPSVTLGGPLTAK